ncbi:PREDICTED: RING-H2 finger protein ATL70-like [Lupinus angustifolius]|uniref:RING-H2 finger protein ATL70-like n=1 Tax=Lupinus angustifolius TaxID=3871 RepID=UPI00092EEBD1|nr:PREDICTED: RING-H2 finger protein ATL70-like [Lupinus angustifolius]
MNNNVENGFDASGFTYGVAFVVGLIFTILVIAFACVRFRMSQNPNILNVLAGFPPSHRGENLVEMEQGLHQHHIETSFESFPKLLYSEVVQNKGGSNIYSSCSICLGDFKESDMLTLLPGCGHLYHLNCVNPWLRLHSTCPICRKSSGQNQNSIASNIGG